MSVSDGTGMGAVSSDSGRYNWFYSFFLTNVPNGGTAPLIPLFLVVAFSGTVLQVGLVTAATSVASIPAFIVWGNLSDHLHMRRVFIIEGFAGLAVSMLVMAFSVNFLMFFIANFLLGLLYTASAPAATALLIEQTPRELWSTMLGKFSRLGGAGYLAGLLLGALWFEALPSTAFDMRLFFTTVGIIAVAGTFLAVFQIKEKRGETRSGRKGNHWNTIATVPLGLNERAKYLPSRIGSFAKLATPTSGERAELGRRLMIYYLVTILISTGFTSFYAVYPNYLVDYLGPRYGIREPSVFIIYIGSSLASTLSYGAVSKFSSAIGEKKLQATALAARVLLIPSFFAAPFFLHSSSEVFISMLGLNAAMGLCWAVISVTGQSIVAGMAGPHTRGEAIGLYNSSLGIGAISGALTAGLITELSGYFTDFLFSSLSIVSGMLVLAGLDVRSARVAPASKTEENRRKGLMKRIRLMIGMN